jgi:hypothetical protein
VTDENHLSAGGDVTLALAVDLGDQGARGVEHARPARAGLVLDASRNAVGAEDRDGARRHLREMLDEARTLRAQALDDMPVVNDLVAHIHRRAE